MDAYKLGKYLFENYSSDFILDMVKDNNKLNENLPVIIEQLNGEEHKKIDTLNSEKKCK